MVRNEQGGLDTLTNDSLVIEAAVSLAEPDIQVVYLKIYFNLASCQK